MERASVWSLFSGGREKEREIGTEREGRKGGGRKEGGSFLFRRRTKRERKEERMETILPWLEWGDWEWEEFIS